jgi:GNAT superfamily N-acetyltransferase
MLLSMLSVDVQRLHAENHPNVFKVPNGDDFAAVFFSEMLADPLTRVFIAEDDNGQALGCALCKLVERPDGPFTFGVRYLLINQISVTPKAQGKGVGKALIDRAVELAHELDVKRIQLDSWAFNKKAHVFFEKLGFEKFNYRFWCNL